MKEVKAFIRAQKAEEVLDALEDLGISDITLLDVMGIGQHMADPHESKYSIKIVKKYADLAKVETVCRAADVDRVVETIRKAGYTGMKGDGMIYVSPVESVVKIRTGVRDDEALECCSPE